MNDKLLNTKNNSEQRYSISEDILHLINLY